ncbi:MAG: YhfC family glutamic-type intramembrane protease [Chloroflexota bacterium]
MVLIPLIVGFFLSRRVETAFKIIGAGILAFLGAQALHIPFNQCLLNPALRRWGLLDGEGQIHLMIFAVIVGLSAGIFEEGGRYLVYRFWLGGERSWREGLLFGLGHGGVESVLLGLVVFYALGQALVYSSGDLENLLSPGQVELARAQLEVYWGMPWYDSLLGALERVAALSFHIGAAVIVLQALKRENILWLGAAIVWHAALNALAVFGVRTWGVYKVEGILLAFGALSWVAACLLRGSGEGQGGVRPPPLFELNDLDVEVDSEQVDESKYV